MRRVVFWQDSNGSTFVMSHIGQAQYFISFYIDKVTLTSKVSVLTLNPAGTEHAMSSSLPLIVEECTVVYARSKFHHSAGGSVWNMRGNGQGSGGSTVVFRNIRVEDPRPTHMHFKIMMEAVPPWSNPEERKRGPGDLYGLTFQNISIAAPARQSGATLIGLDPSRYCALIG